MGVMMELYLHCNACMAVRLAVDCWPQFERLKNLDLGRLCITVCHCLAGTPPVQATLHVCRFASNPKLGLVCVGLSHNLSQ